jgi:hypothetical protein
MLAGESPAELPARVSVIGGSDHLQLASGHISLDKQVGEERLFQ